MKFLLKNVYYLSIPVHVMYTNLINSKQSYAKTSLS